MTMESVTLELSESESRLVRELARRRGVEPQAIMRQAVAEFVGPTRDPISFVSWCSSHPQAKLEINSRRCTLDYVRGMHIHVVSADGDPETYYVCDLIELRKVRIVDDA